MSNLAKRTITGAIYVLSVVLAIYLDKKVTSIYFFVVSMIGLWEFYQVSKAKGDIKPNKYVGFLLGILTYCMFASLVFDGILLKIGMLGCILIFFYLLVYELLIEPNHPFTNIAYTVLGVVYVVVPFGFVNLIVHYYNVSYAPILMSLFIFVWCNDTFAYLVGRKLGKHKLFERISPKKTWEGSLGGLVFTIISAVVVSLFFKELSVLEFVLIAVAVAVVGTFGDLIESMFKRQMGVKDSGNILPGHGGILDRFDSMITVLLFMGFLTILSMTC